MFARVQVVPKLNAAWKFLTVLQNISSLMLVITAFNLITLFRGYVTDKVRQPYEARSVNKRGIM